MSLKGINVLIDGYNLELKYGTGIKTYGITLIKALALLGAEVNVLFGSKNDGNNPVPNESLLFNQNKLRRFTNLKSALKGIYRIFFKANAIQAKRKNTVIINNLDTDFLSSTGIFNLNECYKAAVIAYRILGLTTKIVSPVKADVWHATYPLPIKIKNANKITTIHDLIPLRLPHTTLDNKPFFYNIVKDSLKSSSAIIAVSEHTKKDIMEFFDINPDKIHVTYQPAVLSPFSAEEKKREINSVLKKWKLDFKRYMLFVGAIEPKKNVGRLIEAYLRIDADMPLVIAGKRAWLWEGEIGRFESLFNENLEGKVRFMEYVSEMELRHLYSGAYCFVFPSLYEGFGLPPLEAMNFGCPVIVSKAASLPEICGDAALYVENPYDVHEIKNKIETLLGSLQLASKLSALGLERAEYFSMENYLRRLQGVYKKVI